MIADRTNELILKHFKECDNTSSTQIKNLRGVIESIDGKIVCKTFPYTDEYSENDISASLTPKPGYNRRFFASEEGCVLRLYFHNNRWHLSTHKKLDAFTSHWGSKTSYGSMFLEALLWEYYEATDTIKSGMGMRDKFQIEEDEDIFD